MKTPSSLRPRRSALFSPGSNRRALEKIRQVDADAFILDLEDSVAPEGKAQARSDVHSLLQAWRPAARETVVRVNALDSPWCREDVFSLVGQAPDAILVPKIDGADDVRRAQDLLNEAGAPPSLRLWCMVETPLAILNLHEIARQALAPGSRLGAFVLGANDLLKELRAAHTPQRTPLLYALGAAVVAARAYGLAILDSVHAEIADLDGLQQMCEQARAMGCDGKTLIHPSHVPICNRVFSPEPQAVLAARRIVEAFALPENAGKGVLQVDGRMVELLHAEMARETIAVAEAIAARDSGRS